MSLLNQVLQDLEKRNAEKTPEYQQLSHVRATTVNPSKSYYLVFAIVCITGIITAIFFYTQKTPDTLEEQQIVKQQIAKQSVAKQTANISIKKKPPTKPPTPNTARSTHTATTTKTKTKTKTIQSDKQQIKSGNSAGQKKQQTKIISKQKITKKKLINQTVKKLSNEEKAEQYYLQAKKQQLNSDKQKNLELAIQLNPQHINARLLLSNTLLQQGLTNQSTALLDQSLELFPQNLRLITLRSQLFLQRKQAQDALSILHRIDENHVQDETYLGLLAAAYQQNNDNFNSLKTYQKLLLINPQKAEHWLGLAIALEKQEHPQQALNAYQQALNKKTLKPVIVSYIKQRISILK
jgi:Flp pilus assembly protein TadD